MDHIPIELQTSILKFLGTLSCQHPVEGRSQPQISKKSRNQRPESLKLDLRSASLFPFNTAWICSVWRNILANIPECWTRVVFDVKNDPVPLLEAFSWSKDENGLEVLVFTTSTDLGNLARESENRRVTAVAQALKPHIPRCKSIIFDVTYSSSLNLPVSIFDQQAKNLKTVTLGCRINDIDFHVQARNRATTLNDGPAFIPRLEHLELTGFWFMHLASCGCLKHLRLAKLSISNFTFPQDGIFKFAHCLSQMRSTSIYLRGLSISYEFSEDDAAGVANPEPFPAITITTCYICFDSVSKSFLLHLYSTANIFASQSVTFNRCQIPNIRQIQNASSLYLKAITDNGGWNALESILRVWTGFELTIQDCPMFNDSLLEWMGSEVLHYMELISEHGGLGKRIFFSSHFQGTRKSESEILLHCRPNQHIVNARGPLTSFPAMNMEKLFITDCANFTPSILQQVVKARNDTFQSRKARECAKPFPLRPSQELYALEVSGSRPALTEEEKIWFANYAEMGVIWGVAAKSERNNE